MFGWLRRAAPPPTEQQLAMAQALAGYPPYSPPEWKPDPDPESMRAAALQYREYFLGVREARVDSLRDFLAKFDVPLSLDDAGLMAVSAWLPHWADLLVVDFDDRTVWDTYLRFKVPWTGTLGGLNVIFDLGIYYAECLWFRRTRLEWIVDRGPQGPVHIIKGLPGGKGFDPFSFVFWHCRDIGQAKLTKQKGLPYSDDTWLLKTDSIHRHLLSNAPSGRRSRKHER